ncbi:MAG: hypothetical protein ACXVXJ_08895 [Mycobacteriaceae bacterium]
MSAVPLVAPAPSITLPALTGSWSRTLLVRADGSRDTGTQVTWLQAGSAYVDLRQPDRPAPTGPLACLDRSGLLRLLEQEAFAGTLSLTGEVAEWHRSIDLTLSAPLGDLGRLHLEGERLVEDGVHEVYLEQWERVARGAYIGLQLSNGETPAVLARVGSVFGWARGRSVRLPAGTDLVELVSRVPFEEAVALLDVEICLGTVDERGWIVERSTLPHGVGRDLRPELLPDGTVRTSDLTPAGETLSRVWHIGTFEGDASLLDNRGLR